MVSGIVGLLVGLAVSWTSTNLLLINLHWSIIPLSALFGMFCGALAGWQIAIYSRREAARLILTGNRIVLEDIGTLPVAGYNDFVHLAPAMLGALIFAMGLLLTYRPMRSPRMTLLQPEQSLNLNNRTSR